jgi:hypothetical protein
VAEVQLHRARAEEQPRPDLWVEPTQDANHPIQVMIALLVFGLVFGRLAVFRKSDAGGQYRSDEPPDL